MKNIINVSTGEVKIGGKYDTLVSYGIGSCIVLSAINLEKKIGGMAHIMLPGKAPLKETQNKTKYAEDAVTKLLDLLEVEHNDTKKINVCLIGAANVLKKSDDKICRNNINSLTGILNDLNIEVSAISLGGYLRRTVLFTIETGQVYNTEGDSELMLLHNWDLGK